MNKNFKRSLALIAGVAGVGLTSAITAHADTTDYTVVAGDTISEIANSHNTTVDALVKNNNLTNANLIYVGDKLSIDGASQATQTTTPAKVTQSTTPSTTTATKAPANTASSTTSVASSSEQSAKDFIAYRESRGSYTAQNGRYYGRYQLDRSYLKGDYSIANQEKVFAQYVQQRYGSYANAAQHERNQGWY